MSRPPYLTEEQRKENKKRSGREHYQKNKQKYYTRTREYLARRGPSYKLWANARHRAKKHGLPCNIEATDVVIPEICPVLGIPIVRRKNRGYSDNSPSIDRIIPELGYVKGNIAVISNRANTLKRDASVEELEKVVAYMKVFGK